jgi:hypothetical protein
MISRTTSRTRASAALGLAAVLLALSVAVPLLDRGRTMGPFVFGDSSSHAGVLAHDHGICLQYGAATWAPGEGAQAPAPVLVREHVRPEDGVVRVEAVAPLTHLPRAPPRICPQA